ncbi:MAG: ATP-binding protein, partial [Candidatus Dormiibacterota bacterium]
AQEARNGLSPTSRTSEPSSYQRLREHLTYLQMTTAAEHLAGELDRALREKLSATKVLEQLLAVEVEAYPGAPPTGALRFARYPVHKTLAEFNLDFRPASTARWRLSSSPCASSRRSGTFILLGPPGVGKMVCGLRGAA